MPPFADVDCDFQKLFDLVDFSLYKTSPQVLLRSSRFYFQFSLSFREVSVFFLQGHKYEIGVLSKETQLQDKSSIQLQKKVIYISSDFLSVLLDPHVTHFQRFQKQER